LQLINAYQIQLFVQEVHTITNRHPGMCVWAAGCLSVSYRVFAIRVIVCCTV